MLFYYELYFSRLCAVKNNECCDAIKKLHSKICIFALLTLKIVKEKIDKRLPTTYFMQFYLKVFFFLREKKRFVEKRK